MISQDSQKIWHSLAVTVVPAASEAIEFALNELDADGTEINQLRREKSSDVTVIGYFSTPVDDAAVDETLAECLRIYGFDRGVIREKQWRDVENTDWLKEWKKYWKPTVVGNFVVAPSWEAVDDADKIVIRIEPNMAFGTGTHETTKLCLQAIQDNFTAGETFLDVGTGTGILAIAAAKLNEQMDDTWLPNTDSEPVIYAVDTDEKSVEIAVDNAGLNGVTDRIEFASGSITRDTSAFDFVCANLTADVILPLLPLLLARTRRILLLSGILKEQEESVVSQLEKLGATEPEILQSGEWISILTALYAR